MNSIKCDIRELSTIDNNGNDIENFLYYNNSWIVKNNLSCSAPITSKQAKTLLKKGGLFVRNIFNWDKQTPTCFWYVIKDEFRGFEELSSKVRNQVRKSLRTYEFKKVSYIEMLEVGYELYNKSRERFIGSRVITQEQWKDRLLRDENSEFWIGYDIETGKAASFAINTLYSDYCDYSTMGISPEFPNNTYPMYGLIYEMNRYYLEVQKIPFVCDGSRSITGHSKIQEVLENKFKFRKAYCDLQIYYKSWVEMVIKILFPFRKMIKEKKIIALLNQEAMNKGFF